MSIHSITVCFQTLQRNVSLATSGICAFGLLWLSGSCAPAMAQIGQSPVADSQLILVVSAVEDYATPVNESVAPQDGYRFLAASVIIDNTRGDETANFAPLFQAETIFVKQLGEQHPYTNMVRNTIRALENQE